MDTALLKAERKNAQIVIIQSSIASYALAEANTKQSQVKILGEMEIQNIKNSLNNVSESVGNSVQGQFGKQIKSNFKSQGKAFDSI